MKPAVKHPALLGLIEKAERLAARLPGPLQKPVLAELTPLKNIFLLQRPPRVLVCGGANADIAALFDALAGTPLAHAGEGAGSWESFSHAAHGSLRILDARQTAASTAVEGAFLDEPPDIVLFVRAGRAIDDHLATQIETCEHLLTLARTRHDIAPAVIAIQMPEGTEPVDEAAVHELRACVSTKPLPAKHLADTLAITPALRVRMDGSAAVSELARENMERLAELMTRELPDPAKLEMARLSRARAAQAHLAARLVKSTTAICTAIGAQPIPLADFPILTSLQVAMVAGIIHVSGRELSVRLASEFIGALGVNVGAGIILRETARAAVKLLPGFGNAISGAVAGAGTYGLGRAAIGYFVEGTSLKTARKLLRFRRRKA
jgi:uncharacterized protein (DUF697 family)